MKMKNNPGGINIKFNYLLLVFFMLVGLQFTFGQKYNYKDYVTLNYNNEKITGKVSLNKKFWYSSIYFENKDLALFEYYSPNQLRGFTKGDSVFVIVRVKKLTENGISRRNFALLINDNSVVKLYKSYISLGNRITKELFFYSKQGMNDGPVLIEDTKNSVLSVVSDCNSLKNDINQHGYEYSESYFRQLFENYYKWSKDSTATLLNVSEKPLLKSDSISLSDTSSAAPSLNVSAAPNVKYDSISSADSTTVIPSLHVSETPLLKPDTISVSDTSSIDTLSKVSATPTLKSDSIFSTDTSAITSDNQSNLAPLVDGFRSGDSILFEYNGFYPGQFLNHTKNGKCSINYKGMGGKIKTQNVNSQAVYKISKDPENKSCFGFEIGESATIEVYVLKSKTTIVKPCSVIGLNKNRLIISYLMDNGNERILSVDKSKIK